MRRVAAAHEALVAFLRVFFWRRRRVGGGGVRDVVRAPNKHTRRAAAAEGRPVWLRRRIAALHRLGGRAHRQSHMVGCGMDDGPHNARCAARADVGV